MSREGAEKAFQRSVVGSDECSHVKRAVGVRDAGIICGGKYSELMSRNWGADPDIPTVGEYHLIVAWICRRARIAGGCEEEQPAIRMTYTKPIAAGVCPPANRR